MKLPHTEISNSENLTHPTVYAAVSRLNCKDLFLNATVRKLINIINQVSIGGFDLGEKIPKKYFFKGKINELLIFNLNVSLQNNKSFVLKTLLIFCLFISVKFCSFNK